MRTFLLLMLLVVSRPAFNQGRSLSEDAFISIITCSPGQEQLYSAFGHSAIRVHDDSLRLDHAFNYGVFDFNQPNFYLNFARGNSYYKLAVMYYPDFLYTYQYYNRSVSEQVLNLTKEQKQKVFNYLVWNAQPENASYLYDYFYDNCATRVRDVFADKLEGNIHFDSSFVDRRYSIRELTDIYLAYQPWGDLGIDICLGLPMDKVITPYQYMFLPDYIESSFDHATNTVNDSTFSLVAEKRLVFQAEDKDYSNGFFQPWVIFGILLVIVCAFTVRDFQKNKISFWLDGLLLLVTGLIGLLLILLWTATSHNAAAYNFNLLWALPTNLIALYLLLFRKTEWLSRYYRFALAISVALLLAWSFLPQNLNKFLIPIVIALTVRYALNYFMLGKPSTSTTGG